MTRAENFARYQVELTACRTGEETVQAAQRWAAREAEIELLLSEAGMDAMRKAVHSLGLKEPA